METNGLLVLVAMVAGGAFGFSTAGLLGLLGLPEPLGATGRDRVRIGHRVVHAADPRRDQRLPARSRSSPVVAGLERDDRRRAPRTIAGTRQRVDLRMRFAAPCMESFRDLRAVIGGDHASDHGIRLCAAMTARRDADGAIEQETDAPGVHP